ncbi:MAG: 2-hydroxyacid dehydrogenase [Alphaproteobacteria bacterium]|nr:2-hydroxyacid dehydrogenase [Alphaproteobacteria bacterium]
MKVIFYSARPYDKESMQALNQGKHEFVFIEARLDDQTVKLAADYDAVCGFVNDTFSAPILQLLKSAGIKFILLRSTGFNNVDLKAADALGFTVMRVGYYSPYAVAEFAVTLMLALSRKIHRTYNKVREENFLLDGLLGFDLHGKTVGVIGTGKIGQVLSRILNGFGCHVLAYDVVENQSCKDAGARYCPLPELFIKSDIISLHVPLTPTTHHLINADTISQMKRGVVLINTSRGGLVDTTALIHGLKSQQLGAVGLDVYEEEGDLFFRDLSGQVLQDDRFARLLSFPNVLISGHQAFFTREALHDIAAATLANIEDFQAGRTNTSTLHADLVR